MLNLSVILVIIGIFVLSTNAMYGSNPLTPALCDELTAPPKNTEESLTEREKCSVCDMMVINSETWDWSNHYDALCAGIPAHAQSWVSCFQTEFVFCW